MNRKGFSVIELIFVIIIVGVLTAVAVPRFSLGREDACFVKLRANLSEVETILSREYTKRFLQGTRMTNAEMVSYLQTLHSNNGDKCSFTVNSATRITALVGSKTLIMDVSTDATTRAPTITCNLSNDMCKRLTGKQ